MAVVDFVVDQCPNVVSANFEGSKEICDGSVEVIVGGWWRLERLNISHCVSVTDAGISHIARRMARIKMLNVDGISSLTDSSISELVDLRATSLEELHLDGEELSDLSVFSLSHCPRLRVLTISFSEAFSHSVLSYLKEMKCLEHLHLKKAMDLQAEAMARTFHDFPQSFLGLRYLCLAECGSLNDGVLDALTTRCPKLESLSLTWCWSVTDSGLEFIVERLGDLVLLGLVGLDMIKGHVFACVPQLHLPRISLIDLRQCNQIADDVVVEMLGRKKDLTVLNYYGEVLDRESITVTPPDPDFWTRRESLRKESLRKHRGACCMCSY